VRFGQVMQCQSCGGRYRLSMRPVWIASLVGSVLVLTTSAIMGLTGLGLLLAFVVGLLPTVAVLGAVSAFIFSPRVNPIDDES
jgi:hypothetical protein